MKTLAPSLLDEAVERLVAEFHPEQVILFGSHAWGTPTDDSDVDLFVVVSDSNESSYRRDIRARDCLRGMGFAKDVLVQTRAEADRYRHVRASLEHKVFTEGKILSMDEAERNLVQLWLVKAQHDLATAQLIANAANPYLDMALFHLQQAAEKTVKAYLVFRNQPFRKTHDMEELVSLAATLDDRFAAWVKPADDLTPFATDLRYPMMRELTCEEYDQALQTTQNIFAFVLALLPPEAHPAP